MKLPRINHWREPIGIVDGTRLYAVFAERAYAETPRYTVWIIVDLSKTTWRQAIEAIDEKLQNLEHELFKKYGRGFFKRWQTWQAFGPA